MRYRDLIWKLLAPMGRGALEIVLPGGGIRRFGGLGKGWTARIEVRDEAFFRRSVLAGPIGFAESYMEGEWTTPDLAAVIAFFILNTDEAAALDTPDRRRHPMLDPLRVLNFLVHSRRHNSRRTSRRNIGDHYDLSNAFFALWLDPSLTYSSALFEHDGQTLEEAQRAKYEALCTSLRLGPGDHVLEIGTGWGGFAIHAARTHGCQVTTTTISKEQFAEASQRVTAAGLTDRITLLESDYRELRGRFDKIVSIEMLEAVGERYVNGFFGKCAELLAPQGLLGLQAILCPDQQYEVLRDGVDFIQKHIFPGSLLMSLRRILEATSSTGMLHLLEYRDMAPHYARTLRMWHESFNREEEAIRALGFEERFLRKWRYYLAYCEAAFATRHITVAQIVLSAPRNLSLNAETPAMDFAYARPRTRERTAGP
jgi:cyclopropane-fatty-acyl-phospholipid synthase